MSGKVKMRCARCGKSFKSSGAKQTLCAECEVKARNERAAAKPAATKPVTATVAPQAPKIVGPGASILVPGMAPAQGAVPQERAPFGSATGRGEQSSHEHQRHTQHDHRAAQVGQPATHGHGTTAEHAQPHGAGAKGAHGKSEHAEHGSHAASPARAAKAPQEPKPARPSVPPFQLTEEMRAKIEQRYLELAQPVEFDGIRTRIAGELQVPKHVVKQVVLELRSRNQMPSWWELQSYTGGTSDLERIRAAYQPHLPLPEIGIHKRLAAELGMEPAVVYHGIKRIRAEMRLPQYNPPEAHESSQVSQASQASQVSQVSDGAKTPQSTVETALNAGITDAR